MDASGLSSPVSQLLSTRCAGTGAFVTSGGWPHRLPHEAPAAGRHDAPALHRAGAVTASGFPGASVRPFLLPQAGAEQGLEEESPAFAATVEEPRKERTLRLDWAGLLKRTCALEVFACLMRCGGRLKGVGVREGRQGSASDTGAPGLAHGRCEPGPGARINPGRVVLRLTPPQSQKAQSPTAHPMGGRPGQACTSRGCAVCPPTGFSARAAPVSGPPRHLRSSPHPQHGL